MLRNNASGPLIDLPGRILAGLLRENTEIDPPAGRRTAGGPFRCFPGSSPPKIRPGRPISGPEALLRHIEYEYSFGSMSILGWLSPVGYVATMGWAD